VINALAMAASYDPDPTQFLGIRLPVTLDTCEVIEERWANWLRQDPVVAIETQADNLRRLKALYIDCGRQDQFNLLYGARSQEGPVAVSQHARYGRAGGIAGGDPRLAVDAFSHPPRWRRQGRSRE